MSQLSAAFADGHKCFIPFITAGFPNLDKTAEMILELDRSGADIIEIGLPFSDPVADGPVIQRSSAAALKHGYSMQDVFAMISSIRGEVSAGLLAMTYLNPILAFGLKEFDTGARRAGLNGLLISDLIPEEYQLLGYRFALDTVFLAAPTSSDERLKRICEATRGFLYLVARTGVTGAETDVASSIPAMMKRIRTISSVPVAAGFGIAEADDVREVWKHADGAVVGSALVRFIEDHLDASDLAARLGAYVRDNVVPAQRPSEKSNAG